MPIAESEQNDTAMGTHAPELAAQTPRISRGQSVAQSLELVLSCVQCQHHSGNMV